MKKILIFVGVIVFLFGALAFIQNAQNQKAVEGNPYNKEKLRQETINQLDDPNYQNQILPEELKEKLNNNETIFVYFYSPTCPHCVKATPKVVAAANDLGIDVRKYNLLEFDDGWNDYNISGTPTLVYFLNGSEYSRFEGDASQQEFGNWLVGMNQQAP